MSKGVFRFFLFFIIAVVIPSSGNAAEMAPVNLTEDDSGSSVVLRQGQIMNVSLYGSGSTGYIWEVLTGSESIFEQGETQFELACYLPGCGGTYTFPFKAIAPGQETLKLIYHRPWMTGDPPDKTFEVTVIVSAEIAVPTLTEWGMLIFVLCAGLGSAYCLMRRKRSQL